MGLADEMEMGEKVNFMAAMGLQGVMIMDLAKFDRRNRMPTIVKELPGCVKQILWAPDKSPRGFVCSKLSKELRGTIRELIMIVLRKEIPTNRWFWTSVAKCSCARDSCSGKSPKRVHSNSGWQDNGSGRWGQQGTGMGPLGHY